MTERRQTRDRAAGRRGELLPQERPVQFLTDRGTRVRSRPRYPEPAPDLLVRAYRRMVVGRRFDTQATALTKQGRLAVYPSSLGQEACQVGAALVLDDGDWLFPTYRESMALVSRDIDPVEALSLLRGDHHCGYDPARHHVAPQCTPLGTHTVHEGDFHEALNFAAVFAAPVVFLVQNNQYAISVPLERQSAAPALAYKGIGYGVPSERVDGNDPVAVLAVLTAAAEHARSGAGPFLVEADTYRIAPHTNADDASRYRGEEETERWRRRDPIARLETYLRAGGHLTDDDVAAAAAEAEEFAGGLRTAMNADPKLDPLSLFDHVYQAPTPQLAEQKALLRSEIEAEEASR